MRQQKRKPKILVVEDNDDVRKVITIYLKSNGFKVVESADGRKGLEAARDLEPDLVLLDVLLPKLDGIETLKRLRGSAFGSEIPVILMSAVLQTRELETETADLGVSAYLQKPFQVRKLLHEVQAALRAGRKKVVVESKGPGRDDETERVRSLHDEIPKDGALESFSVPALLASALQHSCTGKLRIVCSSTEKWVYFQNGVPVFAESSIEEETLGAHLVSKGKISEIQRIQAQSVSIKEGRRFGETCLKMGYLGPHELFECLEDHLTSKVISTFEWMSGEFFFEEGQEWKNDVIIARMDPARIILEGLCRYWKPKRISAMKAFTKDSVPFLLPESESMQTGSGFKLNIRETRLLQMVRRGNPVGRMLAEEKLDDEERGEMIALLYGMFLLGIVGFLREGDRREEPEKRSEDEKEQRAKAKEKARKEELAKELMAEYLKLRTADYFKVLGVRRDAGEDEITQAFRLRQRRYHPDTLAGIDRGLVHQKVEELFVRAHTAYKTLMDPGSRARYLAELESGDKKTMLSATSRRVGSAQMSGKKRHEIIFEDAFMMLRNGDYTRASALFQEAFSLEPAVRYEAYMYWAEFMTDPGLYGETCAKKLTALLKKNREEPLLPYLLGNLAMREKDKKRAEAFFEMALEIDPQHIDSARQLRILRMRKHSETSGLFDIFKKKD